MTFSEFSAINRLRCESPTGFNHALSSWSLSDWMTAMVGEVGEAGVWDHGLAGRRSGASPGVAGGS
jgi:hypothetical protein